MHQAITNGLQLDVPLPIILIFYAMHRINCVQQAIGMLIIRPIGFTLIALSITTIPQSARILIADCWSETTNGRRLWLNMSGRLMLVRKWIITHFRVFL